ncbi:MAG: exodeoxyribonuclease VII small subunit [Clostridia bacterium]|nr:exodeoxyribonuclease VII small subunit [Clostridia bacterium]
MATKKEQSFQASMERLEEIVRLLEEGSKPLEESINLYEEGQALVKLCESTLTSARLKIEELGKETPQ